MFMGCCVAVVSLALQTHLRPYHQPNANLLKSLVDMQIFFTFLTSFIIRALDGTSAHEPLQKETYSWMLVSFVAAVLLTTVVLTVAQIAAKHRWLTATSAGAQAWLFASDGGADGMELADVGGGAGAAPTADYRRSQVWQAARGGELPDSGLLPTRAA
jgi:hypothetical protein